MLNCNKQEGVCNSGVNENFKNQYDCCKSGLEKLALLLQKGLLHRYLSAWIYRFLR